MYKQLLDILKNLVSYKTTADNHNEIAACFSYIKSELSWYPFTFLEHNVNNHKSLVISTKTNPKSSHIILNAHIDVVPGDPSLFTLEDKQGKWVGRGVCDMKFAVASFIISLKNLYQTQGSLPDLSIILTSDEEIGGKDGVGYLVDQKKYQGDVVLIPDGGENWHIVENAKGVLHLTLTTHGHSAHASTPWEGESAIDIMLQKLGELRAIYKNSKQQTPSTTLVISRINGGTQTNQVSNLAEVKVDIRYPSSANSKDIVQDISNIFGEDNVTIDVLANSFHTDKNNDYIKKWANLISPKRNESLFINEYGASDGRYFAKHNIPTIISQPVGGGIHTNHEWIDGNSVVRYTKLLVKWLKSV